MRMVRLFKIALGAIASQKGKPTRHLSKTIPLPFVPFNGLMLELRNEIRFKVAELAYDFDEDLFSSTTRISAKTAEQYLEAGFVEQAAPAAK